MNTNKQLYIGTSGWHYKHWIENYYPKGVKEKDFLDYYFRDFNTVEINNSFYRLPSEQAIDQWSNSVPEDFVFAIKASRYITHMKKLTVPEQSTALFLERVKTFGDKLGPLLFQLPPRFSFNEQRLKEFLDVLPQEYKYVLEFRDESWFTPKAYELMSQHNVAFCQYYLGDFQSPEEVTGDFVYIRFHGSVTLGGGSYSKYHLEHFAEKIRGYLEESKQVYCYFNNDENAYAVKNALELKSLLNTKG